MELWLDERQTPNLSLGIRVKETLHREKTQFQEILLVDSEQYGRVLFLDGTYQTTEKDEYVYHEMITHVAMFSHPEPKKVLVIGGGDGGTIREIIKHKSVVQAVLVEIDDRVVEVAKKHLPTISCALGDSRVKVDCTDGIEYVRKRKGEFDVILVDSTDPVGPAVGLFAREFYQDCHAALTEGGMLVVQSESPFFHGELIKGIYNNFKSIFKHSHVFTAPIPTYPSGFWSFTVGSKGNDPKIPVRDIDFDTKFYSPDIHRAAFALPRFLADALS